MNLHPNLPIIKPSNLYEQIWRRTNKKTSLNDHYLSLKFGHFLTLIQLIGLLSHPNTTIQFGQVNNENLFYLLFIFTSL